MREESLMASVKFRFTEPADVQTFGDRWWVYDEAQLVRLPARELVRLEGEIGAPLVEVMEGCRRDSVFGNLAAMWLAIRLDDRDLAGPFAQFNPCVMLAVWDKADQGEDLAAAPLDPGPSDGSPSTPPTE